MILTIVQCSTYQRPSPRANLTADEKREFYEQNQLSLDPKVDFTSKNFFFYQMAITQNGKRLDNVPRAFRYYPETEKKYRTEYNIWLYSWGTLIDGIPLSTLGILGFAGAIQWPSFWNYFFTIFGGVCLGVSAVTFAVTTPDYENLVPLYNDALRKELNMPGHQGQANQFRFSYRF